MYVRNNKEGEGFINQLEEASFLFMQVRNN